jgi:hypothetical protein
VNPSSGTSHARRFVAVLAIVLFIASLFPMTYLASPRWDVRVVTSDGNPIAGINVRLEYQNYSAEGQSHELTLKSDENGRVLFPAQYGSASLFQRLVSTVSSAGAGVHASFGRHAYVFVFGDGYQGSAVTGKYVTDWSGTPESMESRIVATKTST